MSLKHACAAKACQKEVSACWMPSIRERHPAVLVLSMTIDFFCLFTYFFYGYIISATKHRWKISWQVENIYAWDISDNSASDNVIIASYRPALEIAAFAQLLAISPLCGMGRHSVARVSLLCELLILSFFLFSVESSYDGKSQISSFISELI